MPSFAWRTSVNKPFTLRVFDRYGAGALNRLLDGFDGNLTSSKWAKICKVSQDTANREITPLVAAGVLHREGSGRSTHYVIRQDV